MLPHIIDDLRIACALINFFYSRKISDAENGIEIAKEMKKKLLVKNDLEQYLNRRLKSLFQKIDEADLKDFPKLHVQEIRKTITFEWYQINQCMGYLTEHFDQNGDIEIQIQSNKEGEFNVVASDFYSRHSKTTAYFSVVKYKPNTGEILSWICSCMAGKRTCGCCSHSASLIYNLSYARFQSDPLKCPSSS